MQRRVVLRGLLGALIRTPVGAKAAIDLGFDYVNVEYPPVGAVDGQCPEGYAWDFQRQDRCVSTHGWCDGALWTCDGRPTTHAHPQFLCLPGRKRPHRCGRSWWPPVPAAVIPEGAKGGGKCWKYKPTRVL